MIPLLIQPLLDMISSTKMVYQDGEEQATITHVSDPDLE
jgi:hypothetical protein